MTDVEAPQRSYYDIDLFDYNAFPITFSSAMQDRATLQWAGIKLAVVVCTMMNKAPGAVVVFDRDRGARNAYGEESPNRL